MGIQRPGIKSFYKNGIGGRGLVTSVADGSSLAEQKVNSRVPCSVLVKLPAWRDWVGECRGLLSQALYTTGNETLLNTLGESPLECHLATIKSSFPGLALKGLARPTCACIYRAVRTHGHNYDQRHSEKNVCRFFFFFKIF